MIKIKITIDYDKINSFKQFMIKKVIVKTKSISAFA